MVESHIEMRVQNVFWHRLQEGFDKSSTLDMATEVVGNFSASNEETLWLACGFAGLGIFLLLLGMRIFFRRRGRFRDWREIHQFLNGMGDRERASVELQRLEFLLSLQDDALRFESNKLRALTNSERRVLYGTLNDEPVQFLAEELACTSSHIYNLRASIRKKLNLNSDENFRSAIMNHLDMRVEVV